MPGHNHNITPTKDYQNCYWKTTKGTASQFLFKKSAFGHSD